jgi:hypothetical protein
LPIFHLDPDTCPASQRIPPRGVFRHRLTTKDNATLSEEPPAFRQAWRKAGNHYRSPRPNESGYDRKSAECAALFRLHLRRSGGCELAREPDCSVSNACDRHVFIGQHQHVDIDETMAFTLVVAGDAGAHG